MEFARWMFVLAGTGFWAAIAYEVFDLGGPWIFGTSILLWLALLGISIVVAPITHPTATPTPDNVP